jgi:hypothetical protein
MAMEDEEGFVLMLPSREWADVDATSLTTRLVG